MSYQVLARKWRPRNFSEMVGQEHVLRALSNALDSGRLHHAFLFTGTRGVGKTTIARILAKSLNCETGISSTPCGECQTCREIDEGRFVDLIEVDAASRTRVEDTRELLDNVQYAPTRGRYKVYLIDEVHMLSGHSFNALLKTLEEPPPHVKFLLATTDPQRLPITILSRCLQFNLRRLSPERIQQHLAHLIEQEQLGAEAAALAQLARAADGSMRDALSLLDQAIAYGGGQVSDDEVRAMLGTIEQQHIYDLLQALAEGDGAKLMSRAQELAQQVPDFTAVLADLITALQTLALIQQVPDAYQETMGDRERLFLLAGQLSAEDVQLYYQIGLTGRRDLPLAPDARMGLEMVLLRMLAFRPADSKVPASSSGSAPVAASASPAKQETAKPAEMKTSPASEVRAAVNRQAVASQTGQTAPTPVVEQVQEAPGRPRYSGSPSSDWHEIASTLKITGMLRQLADQCALKSLAEGEVVLTLDPVHQPLLTREREQQLQDELENYFSRQVKLTIETEKVAAETPAARQNREQQEKQQAAEQSILQDSNVQNIVEAFNAQVNVNSVQPLD